MWRELTVNDVDGVLSAPERVAYASKARSSGQDVLSDVIGAVVQQCRGYIADHSSNTLAAGATLPERTHLSALHLVRVELLTRLDLEVSDARARAAANALRFFERVSDGKVAIEQATGAVDTSSPTPGTELLNSTPRERTRSQLSGL